MLAILLALLAGALFGLVGVVARRAIRAGGSPEVGAFAGTTVGAAVAVIAAVASGVGPGDVHWHELWPFLAVGVIVPGVANVLFNLAVRAINTSLAGHGSGCSTSAKKSSRAMKSSSRPLSS